MIEIVNTQHSHLQSEAAQLLPLHGDGQGLSVGEFFTVGSTDQNSLRLEDPQVDERHCRIEKRNQDYVVRDLRSHNGTWVNASLVSEKTLSDGDILKIGASEFVFSIPKRSESSCDLTSKNKEWNEELMRLYPASQSDFPILLLGPSGTGKEVLANAIHRYSKRAQGPFISVNCTALSETLIESELFGHLKGSFTGAVADRKGAFEAARGGTLFLDEIGDLPVAMQAKLLRALENNEIRPVGADKTTRTDVRIIAATHPSLKEKTNDGRFREDLFYRLNVICFQPPRLADRIEDFEDILYGFCRSMRVRFSIPAIQKLKGHRWPGNIRELRNTVARASALFPKQNIEVEHLGRLLDLNTPEDNITAGLGKSSYMIKAIEKQMIMRRLAANKGNQRRTAMDLGMPKSTLHDRIRNYGIDLEQFYEKEPESGLQNNSL